MLGACLALPTACSDDDGQGDGETGGEAQSCSAAAPEALRSCVAETSARLAACYADGNAPCADDDPELIAALDALEAKVVDSCATGDFLQLSPEALAGRLRNACESEAGSVAWRTYGGPQGAVHAEADADERSCMAAAHAAARTLVDESLSLMNACLADAAGCDAATIASARETLATSARAEIEGACPNLANLVAVDPGVYVERAALQADCLVAAGHADTSGVELDCGPSHAQFDAPRGQWTQVVVDGDEWGTICGDGSPYAFYIRWAPEGNPLDKLVIGLQGGGVCLFEDDCISRFANSPDLFNAMDDQPIGFGIASDNPEESPFANWTKVYLPYCNQDVFAGGGAVEDFGDLQLPRAGGVNMRSAVRMVRDALWKQMDATTETGFRSDEVVTLFGGWSAGGYGTLYNYHWFLDDLLWPRTIGFPDAGLALDNGQQLGVGSLGYLIIPEWDTQKNLPPYCFAGDCALGQRVAEAISPRLRKKPEQQLLMLTNPYDLTQQGDAFFGGTPDFINSLRNFYCDTKDLDGIHHYYTSESQTSIHVVTIRPDLWAQPIDGEVMRDWFAHAVEDPETLQSRVEEADFVEAFPGVEPYPCEVAP